MMMTEFRDNPARNRYELERDGHVAFADYRKTGSTLTLPYVEAPMALRGSGAAGDLMEAVMQQARAEGLKVIPLCSFAAAWISRHKEYADLVS